MRASPIKSGIDACRYRTGGRETDMKPNKARLLKVIEAVEWVPDKQFDMEVWFVKGCGSVGCAFGHYVHQNPGCGVILIDEIPVLEECPGVGEFGGIDAAAIHFDLEEEDADFLFLPSSYDRPTRANVLRRLRAFVAKLD